MNELTSTLGAELQVYTNDRLRVVNRRRVRSWVGGVQSDIGNALKSVIIKDALEPRENAVGNGGVQYVWPGLGDLEPEQLEAIAIFILRTAGLYAPEEA